MNEDNKKFDPYKPVPRETQEVVFNPEFYRAAVEAGYLPVSVLCSDHPPTGMVSCSHTSLSPWRNGRTAPWPGEETVNAETNPVTDTVQNHIDLITDDLIQDRTTLDQRRSLKGAVERADRVAPASDQAFGRIVGKS